MRTGSSSMRPISFARTAGASYSPARNLTSAFFPSLNGFQSFVAPSLAERLVVVVAVGFDLVVR